MSYGDFSLFLGNNTHYQSVILNKKRIFALFDRRNGRTKHRKRFLLYLATEIAKIQSRRIKNNMTLIFCLYMFLVQPILYQLT